MTVLAHLGGFAVPLLFNLLAVGGAIWLGITVAFRVAPSVAPRVRYAVALTAFAAACLLPILQTARGPAVSVMRLPARVPAERGVGFRASAPRAPVTAPVFADQLDHVARRVAGSSAAVGFTGAWLLVAAALLMREIFANAAVARARSGLRPAAESTRARLAWPDHVPLLLEEEGAPRTIGLLRPAVVLPPRVFAELEPGAAACVAWHELAHARRRDPLVNAALRVARAILWPSPPLWLLEDVARAEREAAADDAAMARASARTRGSVSAVNYAEALLVVAEWIGRPPAFGVAEASLGRGPRLERRIRRLVDRPLPTTRGRLALAASSVVGTVAFVALIPVAAEVVDPASALEGRRAHLERLTTDALRRAGRPRSAAEDEAARTVGAAVRLMRALPARDWRLDGPVKSALAEVQSTSTLEPLATTLEDDDPGVRERSAWALGQIGDRRALPLLVARLQDSSPQVRETTAWALGQIGDLVAMPALVATLEDGAPGARQAAAWALGRLGDAGALEPLIRCLGDPSADVRHGALWALGVIGDGSAASAVRTRLEDPSTDVRSAAAVALGKLDGR